MATNYEQQADYIFSVESSSEHGRFYTVDITPGHIPSCGCTGWATSRNKHKKRLNEMGNSKAPAFGTCKHLTLIENEFAQGRTTKMREKFKEEEAAQEFEAIRNRLSFEQALKEIREI